MPRRVCRALAAVVLSTLIVCLLIPAVASAHERRTIAEKYQFVVGFLSEPAIAGEPNGLDLRVTVPSEDNRPVEGLEKALKATVVMGGGAHSMQLDLQPRFGQPGSYSANFIPTREGSYIFQLSGTIDGAAVEERFESGPGRFNDVQSPQALTFPDRVPSGQALANELAAARRDATIAMLLGGAGLIIGAAGLVTAGLAIRARGRKQATATGRDSKMEGGREAA